MGRGAVEQHNCLEYLLASQQQLQRRTDRLIEFLILSFRNFRLCLQREAARSPLNPGDDVLRAVCSVGN